MILPVLATKFCESASHFQIKDFLKNEKEIHLVGYPTINEKSACDDK